MLQTFMLAVFTEEDQNIQDETGPIDDGFIANAVGSLPSDPFCCAGPEPLDDGTLHIYCNTIQHDVTGQIEGHS